MTSLRKAIFSLHLKPGEKLTERGQCELTGVSRSLMREVLRDLEAHGLISNTPHRKPGGRDCHARQVRRSWKVAQQLLDQL